MAVQTVFSNNLDPTNGSLTARFVDATAFYIDAPLLPEELEIDVFLQVYFSAAAGERVRNLALGKLKDGQIKLNETDTETVVPIPSELLNTGLEMALYFTPSDTTFLEVYAVGKNCSLCGIDNKIDAIGDRLDELENASSATDVILNLILNSLGIPVPVIAGTQAQQDFFFLQ